MKLNLFPRVMGLSPTVSEPKRTACAPRGLGAPPICHLLLPILAALLVSQGLSLAQYPGVQGTVAGQIERQTKTAEYAKTVLEKGAKALAAQDFETAFAYYKSAVDMLPAGGNASADLREEAIKGFSNAAVQLARQRISEGRFEDAKTTVAVVLEDRYNPTYKPAVALNKELKDKGSFFSQTMTPSFVANVEEVKQLLQEAQGFYASGRYDLAFKRYEQVLNVDKFNIAARRGQEQVNVARQKYADAAYSETRGDLMRQVNKAWELPVKKFEVTGSQIIEQPQIDTRGTAAINRKLDDIILSSINFSDATIRAALDQLKKLAAAADKSEPDPARKGVNIVLKLSAEQETSILPFTLTLSDIPLRQAIDYVARAANLKLKVEPYSVVVVPQSEPTEILITKEYKVPPGFIASLPATAAPAVAGLASGSQSVVADRSGAVEFLKTQGVTFEPGASANFIASTSRLIVKNSQSNLDLVDNLVENSLTVPASQVEIEAKFLEITQNNLKELGFDWLLGQFALPFGTGIYGGGGTTAGGTSMPANSFPMLNPGSTVPIGATSLSQGPLTAGNRSGTSAISVNAVDGLLFNPAVGPAPAIMALAGVFTNPQFQVVLRALNQSKGVDLLSAPKVTTKSGRRATIEITREFRFPLSYDPPQLPTSGGTGGSTSSVITPTTPTDFQMEPTGITLEVEPTVGPDGYTIELLLAPRIIEFDGFINYGSPIYANVAWGIPGAVANSYFLIGAERRMLTENTINRPVFSTREVTTQVSVHDGSTVVLGGLMREDVQKVEDKVPIIGDIPLFGRLFRTSADQHVKRNLVIFVTASLIDPAGQPLIRADEEDQVVAIPNAPAIGAEAIPGDALTAPLPQ